MSEDTTRRVIDFNETPVDEVSADVWARQSTLAPYAKLNAPITIVGAGAVGTHVAVSLSKMGCQDITVFDHDTVDLHNYSNQLFGMHDTLDKLKVEMLADACWYLAARRLKINPVKLPDGIFLEGIVVSGVDSMDARQSIWSKTIKMQPSITRYIDCRMGGQIGLVYHLDPSNQEQCEWYESTLYTDKESSEIPCTERSVCYSQFAIASIVASIIRQQCCQDEGVTINKSVMIDMQNGLIVPVEFAHSIYTHLAR